jgi:pyroglutamyl-peptidase
MIPKSGCRFSDKIMRKQARAMRVIIAGFGPFPGAPSNPSGQLAAALARRRRPVLAGIDIASHVFATAYDAVDRDLPKLLARKPDVLLIFGLAGRRREICIEMRARNTRSILFPDAHGYRPDRRAIEAGQVPALQGNAPFTHLLNTIRRTALPARLSRDAGAYLCNYAYWRALQGVRDDRPLVQFVHIPTVSSTRRWGRLKPGTPPLSRLVSACEQLLVALIGISRLSKPPLSAARPLSAPAQLRNRSNSATSARRSAPKRRARSRRVARTGR